MDFYDQWEPCISANRQTVNQLDPTPAEQPSPTVIAPAAPDDQTEPLFLGVTSHYSYVTLTLVLDA